MSALLTVIHFHHRAQLEENIEIAETNGADGVFLIDHGRRDIGDLVDAYHQARSNNPNLWIGLNFLGHHSLQILPNILLIKPSGLWTDNAGIYETNENQIESTEAEAFWESRQTKRHLWNGMYFGGTAFKYQKPVRNLSEVSRIASQLMDVVTTSGDHTGSPPSLDKIKIMKESIGATPLAIASGMTPDNVRQYVPYCSYFLVATGISRDVHNLDPALVKRFAETIRE